MFSFASTKLLSKTLSTSTEGGKTLFTASAELICNCFQDLFYSLIFLVSFIGHLSPNVGTQGRWGTQGVQPSLELRVIKISRTSPVNSKVYRHEFSKAFTARV